MTINGGTGNTVSGNHLYRIFFVDMATFSTASLKGITVTFRRIQP